jgi:mRNA interferase MazF
MVIKRGEIWWAQLASPAGSEPGYRHPVLIIQSDDFNKSLISTVVAVVITSNLRLAEAPGNVFLPRHASRLPKDSVINVSQVVTIDKPFLLHRISKIPPDIAGEVEEGVRLVLGL